MVLSPLDCFEISGLAFLVSVTVVLIAALDNIIQRCIHYLNSFDE